MIWVQSLFGKTYQQSRRHEGQSKAGGFAIQDGGEGEMCSQDRIEAGKKAGSKMTMHVK